VDFPPSCLAAIRETSDRHPVLRLRWLSSLVAAATVIIGATQMAGPAQAADAWIQQDASIDGSATTELSGWSVAMSGDGTSVVVGSPYKGRDGNIHVGQVRVFTWDGIAWTQQGGNINGQAATDIAGWSVALSADGTSVAVGAPRSEPGGRRDAGQVRVFTWNGSAWTQQGADIDGEAGGDQSGFSVAMSATGTTVAGQVRIFTWNGSAWTQQGADINGQAALDQSGYSVAISADGASVAIGAPVNTNAAVNAGQVRIFTWTAVNASAPGPLTYFTFLLPDGRECTSISPMRVEVGTMVELPGVNALCQTMPGSTVAGWTIPVPPRSTGAGSSSLPFNPGNRVRVIESQRFTLVPFDPIVQIEYDANISAADNCTVVDVAHSSDDGRVAYAWVPRVDFAMARTATAAPCVPEGYELIGWNTCGDGSGTAIAPGAPLPKESATGPVNNHHLYAQWSALR